MDEYYADLTRGVLAKAHTELIDAQNYLVKAEINDAANKRLQSIINKVRELLDVINMEAIYLRQ
jgi:hypothetical protein